jgi:hypothetical protein
MGVGCIPFITVPYGICMVTRLKMENWLVRQRICAVRAFIKSKSVQKVHRRFRYQFGVGRHGRILSCSAILNYVCNA